MCKKVRKVVGLIRMGAWVISGVEMVIERAIWDTKEDERVSGVGGRVAAGFWLVEVEKAIIMGNSCGKEFVGR